MHPLWDSDNRYQVVAEIALKQVFVDPEKPVFQTKNGKFLPPQAWQTVVSLIDTNLCSITANALDTPSLRYALDKNKGFGMQELADKLRSYPKFPDSLYLWSQCAQADFSEFSQAFSGQFSLFSKTPPCWYGGVSQCVFCAKNGPNRSKFATKSPRRSTKNI